MLVICFRFLLCFGCNLVIVGDTYVVCWFSGCCLFTGSLVCQLLLVVIWLKFTSLGPWGCSWAYSCFLASLLLVLFFCLLRLCKVGFLRRQLELFFFLVLWGAQFLHPQVDLWFYCLSCLAKSRSVACSVPAYSAVKFC
jgi:hypothetical protein